MSTAPQIAQATNAAPAQHAFYAAGDFIRPGEQQEYDDLNAALLSDLAPQGILEHTLVDEIRRATWRLRRCGNVEATLVLRLNDNPVHIFDPMEVASVEKIQRTVDQSRSQAHRLIHKCTAELRRLQTDRQYSQEVFAEAEDTSGIGIADWQAITKAHADRTRSELRQKTITQKAADAPIKMPFTKQTQSAA